MITYFLSQLGRFLRETLTLAPAAPQVAVCSAKRVLGVNGTVHCHGLFPDLVCQCGEDPTRPHPAVHLVQGCLAAVATHLKDTPKTPGRKAGPQSPRNAPFVGLPQLQTATWTAPADPAGGVRPTRFTTG